SQVMLVANKNMPESLAVAEHYQQKRSIPKENFIALDLPVTEDISREDYDRKMVAPIRAALKDRKDSIQCLLCIYGVPLRVGGKASTDDEKGQLAKVDAETRSVREKSKALEIRIKELESKAKQDPDGDEAKELEKARQELKKLSVGLRLLEN